jgi:hypothetical protein
MYAWRDDVTNLVVLASRINIAVSRRDSNTERTLKMAPVKTKKSDLFLGEKIQFLKFRKKI